MSETMTVHFVTRTGHVLGAVTRLAETAETGGTAAGGEDVLVRGLGADPFLVPGTELSILEGDPEPLLLSAPRSFHVPPQGSEAESLPAAAVGSITLAFNQVTVQVGAAVPADEDVWVLIAGGPLVQPLVVTGVIPQGQNNTALPVTALASGTYHMLALVRGRQPLADTDTI